MSRHICHIQASAIIMASAAISHTGWHPAMVQFVARAGMQLQTGMWLHIWHSQAVADIQLLPRGGMWRHIGICPHTSDRLACMCCPICAQSWHVEADWHVPAYLAYSGCQRWACSSRPLCAQSCHVEPDWHVPHLAYSGQFSDVRNR